MPEGSSIDTTSQAAQGRGLAAQAAGGQDRHQLYRPRRAALLPGHVARAARPVLRQDRRADLEREGARRPQERGSASSPSRARSPARASAPPRSSSARPRPGRWPSASWAPTPPRSARSPSRFAASCSATTPCARSTPTGASASRASTSCSTRTACAPWASPASDASEQLQFLLTGAPVTQVREDIRTVEVIARTSGGDRLDPAQAGRLHPGRLVGPARAARPDRQGRDPHGRSHPAPPRSPADHHRARRHRRAAAAAGRLGPGHQGRSSRSWQALPAGYRIEMGGTIEEAGKANARWRRSSR
jgi:hypothetical protein